MRNLSVLILFCLAPALAHAELFSDKSLWTKRSIGFPGLPDREFFIWKENDKVTGVRDRRVRTVSGGFVDAYKRDCAGIETASFTYDELNKTGFCEYTLKGKITSSFIRITMKPSAKKEVFEAVTDAVEAPNSTFDSVVKKLEKTK